LESTSTRNPIDLQTTPTETAALEDPMTVPRLAGPTFKRFVAEWNVVPRGEENAARHFVQRLSAIFSRLMARKIALNHWNAALQAHVYSDG
jgi:hypothetical protein